MEGNYPKFIVMIATSTNVMFALMYLNTWEIGDVWFSQTRMWMALYMGAAMTIIMLASMLPMYTNTKINVAIFSGAIVILTCPLYLVRSQDTVSDVSWMEAMIPHHSIAILTSSRANISDPRLRRLADGIIEAQLREIAEMKALIADIEGGPSAKPEIDGK